MRLTGFFSLEERINGFQLFLIILFSLLAIAGLVFLVLVHVAFLLLAIPGVLLMISLSFFAIMKWLAYHEDKEGGLSALWGWDAEEKKERTGETGAIEETQRQIEEMKSRRENQRMFYEK